MEFLVERVKHLFRLALGPLKRRNAKSNTGTENCKNLNIKLGKTLGQDHSYSEK